MNTIVFNASPLIVLAKAGLLQTVLALPEEVVVPRAVADEIKRCDDPSDAACNWLESPGASALLRDAPNVSDFILAWGLGAGESAVIALAETIPQSTAILDDLAARRCAAALGLPVTGTLGLLLMAKKLGHIRRISPALDAVVAAGLFISERHLAEVRRRAGE